MKVQTKRIYEEPGEADGFRVLVDRLWPRGVSKEKARLDLWLKDIAPSPELRQWFAHDPAKWDEFRSRYEAELRANEPALAVLREHLAQGTVTLLYATSDTVHNSAAVLRDFLTREG
ncbi:MAG: DUF488 domain-containing protein [Chloroflexi bacterium]|nr:DUF488 domain-containing protein [Chloroflexota bacterium]